MLIHEFIEKMSVLPDYIDVKCMERLRCTSSTRRLVSRSRVLMVSEGGFETIPWAFLMPPRPGDHPMSERESMAIRHARWEPPSFGYRLRNSSAQAHATDQNPYCPRR